jgi:hypothetical protein
MKEITLSSTINKINLDAFYGCSSLQSIILPDALTFLGSNSFSGCSSLVNVVLNNTNNLICIGDNVFLGVGSTGTYTFGLYENLGTPIIYDLIALLPATWTKVPNTPYLKYVDFAILYDRCIVDKKIENNTCYFDLSNIPISYADFHTLFFDKNTFFNLNCSVINQLNKITPSNLKKYITINNQTDICGNSFNLMSTLNSLYECSMPQKCWSVESIIMYNKHISKLKTIFNFNVDNKVIICNKDKREDNKCDKSDKCEKSDKCDKCEKSKNNQLCNLFYNNVQKFYVRGPTIITLDDFFNMFEAQGVIMATDNSYNVVPDLRIAKGLPINAATIKYVGILNLFIKSMYKCVDNLNIRLSYLIDFSGSMPTSVNDTNNYRYNPNPN